MMAAAGYIHSITGAYFNQFKMTDYAKDSWILQGLSGTHRRNGTIVTSWT
jgi:hypothetical protein